MFYNLHVSYGFSKSFWLTKWKIFYINGNKIKKDGYYYPSDGTSVSPSKELAMKKSYSEYLERFLLGIGGYTKEGRYISYGENTDYGYIDTTGTATGISSTNNILKALKELVEKNELLLFWYTDEGERFRIEFSDKENLTISSLNFIANKHKAIAIRNLSNYYTVISFSFLNKQITGCGIACALSIEEALQGALIENRLIEWQNFQNINSKFYRDSCFNTDEKYEFIYSKIDISNTYICKNSVNTFETKEIRLKKYIPFPEIVVLNREPANYANTTTIKLVSKYLLNCMPAKEKICLSSKQGILKRLNIDQIEIDCFLV